MIRTSCLYDGMVRHRRFEPVEHGFRYRVQLLYLDLAEVERGSVEGEPIFGRSRVWSCDGTTPVSFRREDHLGSPETPLEESVRDLVERRLGRRPRGPIRILTVPRYLGLTFNPVSFYYCFDADERRLDALVAEVTNTPWSERHCYVLDLAGVHSEADRPLRVRTRKSFHVSPFMEMEMRYDWRVAVPGPALTLSIRNELDQRPPAALRRPGAPYFQADLALRREELEPSVLRRAMLRQPWLSGRMLLAIYWQAVRLFVKRVPYIRHPEQQWPQDLADPALLDGAARRIAEVTQR